MAAVALALAACDTPQAAAPGAQANAQPDTYTGSHINGVIDPNVSGSTNTHWIEKQLRNTGFQ